MTVDMANVIRDERSKVRILAGAIGFFFYFPENVQTISGAHTASFQ